MGFLLSFSLYRLFFFRRLIPPCSMFWATKVSFRDNEPLPIAMWTLFDPGVANTQFCLLFRTSFLYRNKKLARGAKFRIKLKPTTETKSRFINNVHAY
jgi:hypothetical protein